MKIEAVRRHALSLPEVTQEPHFKFSSFRVRGKIFVTFPPDGLHLHVFVGDEIREPALAMHPEFCQKLTWGAKVVGLRIFLQKAKPSVVKQLLNLAWRAKAPKALLG